MQDVFTSGLVILTKFDLSKGIISGTFEFTRQIQGLYPEYTSGNHVSVSVNTTPYDTYYRWYIKK